MTKNIFLIAGSLLLVVVLTFGILLALRAGSHKTTTAAKVPLTATQLMAGFATFATHHGIDADSTLIGGSDKSVSSVLAFDAKSNVYVQFQSSHFAILSRDGGYTSDAQQAAVSKIEGFFVASGLSKGNVLNGSANLVRYASAAASCDLSKQGDPAQQLTIACIDISGDALTTVDALISLWPAHKTAAFDTVTQKDIAEGSYVVTSLRTSSSNDATSTHVLIYVKDKGTWQYIGDAGTGTPVEPSERLIINADIKAGMENATYGAALTKAVSQL